jgi:hypothetical protein
MANLKKQKKSLDLNKRGNDVGEKDADYGKDDN